MKRFFCDKCGKCCEKLPALVIDPGLDDGTGKCKFYDSQTNLCTIYDQRPDICNVETSTANCGKKLYSLVIFLKICCLRRGRLHILSWSVKYRMTTEMRSLLPQFCLLDSTILIITASITASER